MMWDMGGIGGWGMVMGGIWMVLFWGVIIGGFYLLITRLDRGERGSAREPSALELLERRYVRGEIGAAEFEEMRQRLTAAPSAARNADERVAPGINGR